MSSFLRNVGVDVRVGPKIEMLNARGVDSSHSIGWSCLWGEAIASRMPSEVPGLFAVELTNEKTPDRRTQYFRAVQSDPKRGGLQPHMHTSGVSSRLIGMSDLIRQRESPASNPVDEWPYLTELNRSGVQQMSAQQAQTLGWLRGWRWKMR